MSQQKLQKWVQELRHKDMPVVGTVIAELNQITGSDASNASELAEVILRDPNLTSHVLRVANSVQYNYSRQKINTISRAIVLIGLKGVRAICISLLILDRLLSDQPKERVMALVAQGFHAATQAQNMLNSSDSNEKEEAFIAGLLYNLGEMAFWMSDETALRDKNLTSQDPKLRQRAVEQVLGGSFRQLTRELGKYWQLGETLQAALFPGDKPSPKAIAVITGVRLSRAATSGWDSPQVRKVLGEVASLRGISLEQALVEVRKGADEAAKVASNYGAAAVCPYIPTEMKAAHIREMPKPSKIMKSDPRVQLNILRELSSAATEKNDVNTIFQMVLEGMHRGAGLERVAIAFVKGRKLQSKYMIGEPTEHWRDAFLFDVGPYTDNIFTYASAQNTALWLDEASLEAKRDLYPSDVVTVLGRMPSLLFPLRVNGRVSAIFYADRYSYGGKIDEEQFESFKHFGTQAQLSLNSLSARAGRA